MLLLITVRVVAVGFSVKYNFQKVNNATFGADKIGCKLIMSLISGTHRMKREDLKLFCVYCDIYIHIYILYTHTL